MNINEFIKGIIIGVAKIIPGLSGAVIMISFNLYDRAIYALTNFFDDVKKNFLFLFNLSIGIIIGIVLFSKVISYFITNYYTYTTSLFIGLILGGFPIIIKKINKSKSNYIVIFISFLLMFILSISNINNSYAIKNNFIDIIVFFIAGLLEAFGTVVPGVSSTALLMLMGVYNIYISSISNIFNINSITNTLLFFIPFSTGMILGIILITILINYLFKHHYQITFSSILGVSISSILLLIIKVLLTINSIKVFILSLIIVIISYLIMSKI